MSDQQLLEQFKLIKTARKLEQMGNYDRALELYLELHEKFDPNTTDAYERPAILLERKRDYQGALDMCQKALDAIDEDLLSSSKGKFQKRMENIREKMKDEPVKKEKNLKDYRFGVLGFRSKNKSKMIIALFMYTVFGLLGYLIGSYYMTIALIGVVYAGTYFIDVIQSPTKKLWILIALLVSLGITVYTSAQIPEQVYEIHLTEHEAILENGDELFQKEDDYMPKITDLHIENAIKLIKSEVEVKDATILKTEVDLAFGLLLQPSTLDEKAKDLGEKFVELLAHQVSQDEPIDAPNFKSHGQLYDYFNLIVSAGEENSSHLVKGTKSTAKKYITWLDE